MKPGDHTHTALKLVRDGEPVKASSASLRDQEAERSVLACCLLSPSVLPMVCVDEGLTTDAFTSLSAQQCFAAMVACHDRAGAVEAISVADELSHRDPRARELLDSLDVTAADPGAVRAHARMLVDFAEWRRVHQAGGQLQEAALRRDEEARADAEQMLGPAQGRAVETFNTDQLAELVVSHLDNGEEEAIPLPFRALTEASGGGLRPGEMTLVGGWTGHGKSLWLDMQLEAAVRAGHRAHLWINEMTPKMRALRTVARWSNVGFRKLRSTHGMTDGDYAAVRDALAEGLPFGITNAAGWSAQQIARDIRWRGVDIAGVDILHLVEHRDERDMAAISQTLSAAARSTGCHVVATVHLNEARAVGEKLPLPVLRDIRQSGMLKNDADQVLFVYRKQADDEQRGAFMTDEATAYFRKARHGEEHGIRLVFNGSRMRFELPAGPMEVAA